MNFLVINRNKVRFPLSYLNREMSSAEDDLVPDLSVNNMAEKVNRREFETCFIAHDIQMCRSGRWGWGWGGEWGVHCAVGKSLSDHRAAIVV